MLTLQEIQALLQLADRAAKSPAEALWLTALVTAINAQLETQKASEALP